MTVSLILTSQELQGYYSSEPIGLCFGAVCGTQETQVYMNLSPPPPLQRTIVKIFQRVVRIQGVKKQSSLLKRPFKERDMKIVWAGVGCCRVTDCGSLILKLTTPECIKSRKSPTKAVAFIPSLLMQCWVSILHCVLQKMDVNHVCCFLFHQSKKCNNTWLKQNS